MDAAKKIDCETPFEADMVAKLRSMKPSFQQTMLRVKDPKESVEFYVKHFGMTLVQTYDFSDFSLYFLATLKDGEKVPGPPGSQEAHEYLWNGRHGASFLELTHNHGTEVNRGSWKFQDHAGRPQFYHNGNSDPRGFGHIAFNVLNVYEASKELEAAGAKFKKRPDEGRMKGIAFVLDPDGYWIELVKRDENADFERTFNLSQTMIRIDDPKTEIPFWRDLFGMDFVSERDFSDFSLYFCATDGTSSKAQGSTKLRFDPCLELTHNHGTEKQEGYSYTSGNEKPHRGFGHIGFLVDDLNAYCGILERVGVEFIKKPSDGKMRGLAFVKSPSGYWVEVIQRGFQL